LKLTRRNPRITQEILLKIVNLLKDFVCID